MSCYFLLLECNVGYYLNNEMCERCPGNSIKQNAGNDTSCSAECDGTSMVPNTQRTACGKLS